MKLSKLEFMNKYHKKYYRTYFDMRPANLDDFISKDWANYDCDSNGWILLSNKSDLNTLMLIYGVIGIWQTTKGKNTCAGSI